MPIDPTILSQLNTNVAPLQTPAQSLGQIQQLKDQALTIRERSAKFEQMKQAVAEDKALRQLFATGMPTVDALANVVGPERATQILSGIDGLDTAKAKKFDSGRQRVGAIAGGILALPEPMRASAYAHAIQQLMTEGLIKPTDVPQQYDENFIRQAHTAGMTPEQQQSATNTAADNVRADRQITETERHNKESEAIQRLSAQGGGGMSGNAQAVADDAKIVAQGIKDGKISPEVLISARTTAGGLALQAELTRLGVDANTMTREWMATKSAVRALNNTSQLRLAQVINKASASLDKLEELNTQWSQNATRWGITALNKASLALAQNGAYGPEAASVATRLKSQIADVTSELGQGIMGGNSPTDHALKLAAENLSSEWTDKVLADSIKQIRYNLNLAQSARNEILEGLGVKSTQVQTPEAGSTKEPPAAGGVPENVKAALRGMKDGRHTLSDGSVWIIKDGQISKGGG